jgi:hypothetical protein
MEAGQVPENQTEEIDVLESARPPATYAISDIDLSRNASVR